MNGEVQNFATSLYLGCSPTWGEWLTNLKFNGEIPKTREPEKGQVTSPCMPDICRDDPRRASKDLKLDKYENFDVLSSSYKDPFVHGRQK